MTITIADSDTTITLDLLKWEEERKCEVAIRDVPLRSVPKIDIGTYVLEKKVIDLSCRASAGEKGELIGLYDKKTLITITDGDWSFSCWFLSKPIAYKLAKVNIERNWIIDMRFVVSSYSYGGAYPSLSDFVFGYDQPTDLYVLGLEIDDMTSVSRHEWVNNEEEVKTEVWNKDPFRMTYTMRISDEERYAIELLLESHIPIQLTDLIYNIIGYVWFEGMRLTNDKKYIGPSTYGMKDVHWIAEIDLIVIWAISEGWDFWSASMININDDIVYNNEGASCEILWNNDPCGPEMGTIFLLLEDYPLAVDNITTFSIKVKGSGNTNITITYDDGTTTNISYTVSANWEELDILSYLDAGKSISKITLSKNSAWETIYYDDIVLVIS